VVRPRRLLRPVNERTMAACDGDFMVMMVLPGTKWPSDGESAATLGKGRSLLEAKAGALVARKCGAR
jgi:hypothetical protein